MKNIEKLMNDDQEDSPQIVFISHPSGQEHSLNEIESGPYLSTFHH
jgi:hypothetical protein